MENVQREQPKNAVIVGAIIVQHMVDVRCLNE